MKMTSKLRGLLSILSISMLALFTSCRGGQNMTVPGMTGPNAYLLEDQILISMVFNNIQSEGGLRYQIPNYKDSYVEISPDIQSDGTLMSVSISLQDLYNGGLKEMPAEYLPGGRSIPGITGGTLPAVAFSIEQFHNITFYVGQNLFGMFIPIKGLNLQGSMLTTRFYGQGTRIGNLTLVGEDENNENGGIFLLLNVAEKRIQTLQRRQARYNRRR